MELAIILKGNSTNSEVIELSKYFNYLPKGSYRIVKTIALNGEDNIVTAEFEIKK